MKTIIAYYRVSTRRQGESGLGLEAQKAAVLQYGTPVAEYTETESGKKKDRPALQAAIAHCRFIGATLVIAKLDRLARNVAFTSSLMESGLDFICCDMPDATPFTIHILAAVAEQEAKMISSRTKAALQAAKARGVQLGNPKGTNRGGGRRLGQKGRDNWNHVRPFVRSLRDRGESLQQIADELNKHGLTTATGNPFSKRSVQYVLTKGI